MHTTRLIWKKVCFHESAFSFVCFFKNCSENSKAVASPFTFLNNIEHVSLTGRNYALKRVVFKTSKEVEKLVKKKPVSTVENSE